MGFLTWCFLAGGIDSRDGIIGPYSEMNGLYTCQYVFEHSTILGLEDPAVSQPCTGSGLTVTVQHGVFS